ncbi:uncharacterized protein [Montipora capricornis]|uniref:uncharacterized protein n=1 Tax=Montipora capricornis TaxID=246305 RepID=UPI0035F19B8C
MENYRPVRQRTERSETTKDKSGALPPAVYSQAKQKEHSYVEFNSEQAIPDDTAMPTPITESTEQSEHSHGIDELQSVSLTFVNDLDVPEIIERHLSQVPCYADDTQLYLSFRPGDDEAQDGAHRAMEASIKDIRKWMIDGRLLLNETKTEFLAIGSRQQLSKLRSSSIEVGNQRIDRSSSVRNLGVILDESLGMNSHINQICKASFYRISKYLSKECRQSLVHAYVTSRLDYCNSLLYGLPKYQLSKLQRIQTIAARLITDTMKFDHINPVLYNLHWLPVNYRIQFKILVITFKAIYGMAPSYLSNLICIRSSSRYSLCNNDTIFLERPKGVMRTTLGARSFHASAPALWNSLPAHIRRLIR